MARILLVDDDHELAEMVRLALSGDHSIETVHDGVSASRQLASYDYDLVLLDMDLPGKHGLSVLQEYRSAGAATPVIILTGQADVARKEAGLDAGADDYLTKPFEMQELAARVRAALRRSSIVPATQLRCGDLVLDPGRKRAMKKDQVLILSPKELSLLEFFMRNPNQPFSNEELLGAVCNWDSEMTNHAVEKIFLKLQQKADPDGQMLIREGADYILQDETDPFLGKIFAEKYSILELIGGGGAGLVYKAKHVLMERIFAIKVLFPHLVLRQDVVKRFQQEARAVAALSHPNIVSVHDMGIAAQGQPYLVMEFIDGVDLSAVIEASGALAPKRAIAIFLQACEALSHAHEKGIVHRDLKPSNFMLLDADGKCDSLKLVDFGLAKIFSPNGKEGRKLTRTGEIIGSPHYMSPEQCRGQQIDERSDIYSLGCVMYEVLTGSPPFPADDVISVLSSHLSTPPKPVVLGILDERSNQKISDLLSKALAKDPNDRYQSMRILSQQLLPLQDLD